MVYKKIVALTGVIFFLLLPSIVIAQTPGNPTAGNPQGGAPAPVQLTNPLTGTTGSESIPKLLGKIINAVLGVVGSLALVMFIYGGVTWMLAAGNAERVTKGKNILIWATIGLVVIFAAYALVKFVFTSIGAPS